MSKLESVLTYLTKTKGVTLQYIIERIEYEGKPIQRSLFNSWRRSTADGRPDKLADLIVQSMPEFFTDGMYNGELPPVVEKSDYQKRFDALMEKRVEELTAEVERQRARINELLDTIVKIATSTSTSKKE